MPTPRLELRKVGLSFHTDGVTIKALSDVSFGVMPGEFVTVIGPSGSGKSTLFNLITGLLQPDGGEILIDGETAPSRLGQFGYMPQKDLLLPWRNVLDNAIIPMELRGVDRNTAREKAREML